jgi:hypothetical protein
MLAIENTRLTIFRMMLIAIPSYAVAFQTEKVFYVVPTIAMMMMIANSVEHGTTSNRNRVDEDTGNVDDAGGDAVTDGDVGV